MKWRHIDADEVFTCSGCHKTVRDALVFFPADWENEEGRRVWKVISADLVNRDVDTETAAFCLDCQIQLVRWLQRAKKTGEGFPGFEIQARDVIQAEGYAN